MPDIYLIALYAIVFSYLCGSVPFGLILTRLVGLGDIRNIGSGNIGATNVLRTGNKKIAAAVLLLDGLKGFLAVYLVYRMAYHWLLPDYGFEDSYGEEQYIYREVMPYMLLAGLCAVLGHIFPVWLRFKGGKGVATAIGAYFGIEPFVGLIFLAVWLLTFAFSKISSLAAMVAFFFITVLIGCATFGTNLPMQYPAGYAFIIMALIFWRHKDNIKRLRAGTEPRFGSKK